MSDLAGKLVAGRYEILEKLGEGGFATVWKAKQLQPEGHVAVKVLLSEFADDEIIVEDFLREAGLYVDFRDEPNIATIIECGKDEELGVYFLVMTLLGKTVDDKIREDGKLPPSEVLRMAEEIGNALESVHSKGLVHRDIKCSNIMTLPGKDRFILTDFGIGLMKETAEKTRRTEELGTLAGTWAYAPAEQARAREKSEIGPPADFYALGVSMFRAATGEYPFPPDFPQVMFDHAETEPPNPSAIDEGVPRELSALILRCMEKAPEDRFANAGEFLAAVRAARAGKIPGGGSGGGGGGTDNGGSPVPKILGGLAIAALLVAGAMYLPRIIGGGDTIALVSQPPGATYRLYSGEKTRFGAPLSSGTTPADLARLEPGEYAIDLEKEGYLPLDGERITLAPDAEELRAPALERAYSLTVESEPTEATVIISWLDESRMSYPTRSTPAEFNTLRAGPHEIRVEHPNFLAYVDTVNITSSTGTIRAELEAANRVRLWLFTTPAEATVWIDGGRVASPTNCEIPDISGGRHQFRFEKAGYRTIDTSMVINFEETVDTLWIALSEGDRDDPPPPPQGTSEGLTIQSDPSGARIFLNGKDMQAKTPHTFEDFPIGKVDLALKLGGCYKNYTTSLNIPPDGTSHTAELTGTAPKSYKFNFLPYRNDISVTLNGKPVTLGKMFPYDIRLRCGTNRIGLKCAAVGLDRTLKYEVLPGSAAPLLLLDWEKGRVIEQN